MASKSPIFRNTRTKGQSCSDCGEPKERMGGGWYGYHGYCRICHAKRAVASECQRCDPNADCWRIDCPWCWFRMTGEIGEGLPPADPKCPRCTREIEDTTTFRLFNGRRNSDAEHRRLVRAVIASPDDDSPRRALMASILRTRGHEALLPPPITANEFCKLCSSAVSSGVSLMDWGSRNRVAVILRSALELLVPPDGRHEMLRVVSSMPGMDDVQIVGLSVRVYEDRDGWTPRDACAAYVRLPYVTSSGGVRAPDVREGRGGYSEVTNFWMRRLAESQDVNALILGANDLWSRFVVSARETLGPDAPEAVVQGLALTAARDAFGRAPPAEIAPSDQSAMSGADQEALIRHVVPCVEAGVRLRVWADEGGEEPHVRAIHWLESGWERGVIPDSPTARRAGAVGATPLAWCMRGGDVVEGGESRTGRRHVGGTAAVSFCLGTTGGYVDGPAEELLPANIRWSTAVWHHHEYPLIRGIR